MIAPQIHRRVALLLCFQGESISSHYLLKGLGFKNGLLYGNFYICNQNDISARRRGDGIMLAGHQKPEEYKVNEGTTVKSNTEVKWEQILLT